MLIKMQTVATPDEIAAVEAKVHGLGYTTGKMIGEEVTLIGVYGDISACRRTSSRQMPGVERLIPISRAYKRAAQKGEPGKPLHADGRHRRRDRAAAATSSSSRARARSRASAQIMESARMVKEAGAQCLRGGVVKYRSSPYSGWEGLGSSDQESLRRGLELIVRAGREFEMPTVVEILDQADVALYEDAGRRLPAGRRAEQQEPGAAESPARHEASRDPQARQLARHRSLSPLGRARHDDAAKRTSSSASAASRAATATPATRSTSAASPPSTTSCRACRSPSTPRTAPASAISSSR